MIADWLSLAATPTFAAMALLTALSGAGASLRKATRFNAPRGSPAASARPAAVISESI